MTNLTSRGDHWSWRDLFFWFFYISFLFFICSLKFLFRCLHHNCSCWWRNCYLFRLRDCFFDFNLFNFFIFNYSFFFPLIYLLRFSSGFNFSIFFLFDALLRFRGCYSLLRFYFSFFRFSCLVIYSCWFVVFCRNNLNVSDRWFFLSLLFTLFYRFSLLLLSMEGNFIFTGIHCRHFVILQLLFCSTIHKGLGADWMYIDLYLSFFLSFLSFPFFFLLFMYFLLLFFRLLFVLQELCLLDVFLSSRLLFLFSFDVFFTLRFGRFYFDLFVLF